MIFNHDLSRYRYQLAQQFNPPEGDRYYTPLDKPEPQFPSCLLYTSDAADD